jgi:hypothetical protein
MSTLVAQTISNGTVSTSSANVIQGCAKAWVNFNGVTTTTIRASYNVSSVTRSSAGTYEVNFTNAMADANYVSVVNSTVDATTTAGIAVAPFAAVPTSSTLTFRTYNTGFGTADSLYNSVAIFR